jgi:hypothetical protein
MALAAVLQQQHKQLCTAAATVQAPAAAQQQQQQAAVDTHAKRLCGMLPANHHLQQQQLVGLARSCLLLAVHQGLVVLLVGLLVLAAACLT